MSHSHFVCSAKSARKPQAKPSYGRGLVLLNFEPKAVVGISLPNGNYRDDEYQKK